MENSTPKFVKTGLVLGGLTVAIMGLIGTVPAVATDLAGSWHGSGSVNFANNEERVRCRARYSRTSSKRYKLHATCTTGGTRVTQSAVLRRVGANEYEGRFHNREYGISGSIYVELNGRWQNVTLESGSGTADLNLRKR